MELSATDHQLLVSHYSSMGAEASHTSFGSMMALMTAEQDLEGARKAQTPHFMYYNDPYQAAVFHAEQSGTPDQLSTYDLMIAAVDDAHAAAVSQLDHGRSGREGAGEDQKVQLQKSTVVLANKIYPKSEAPSENMAVYSQNSSHSDERRDFSASLDMEISGACRKQLSDSLCSTNITDDSIKEKIRAHPEYHKLVTAYLNCRKVGAPPDVARRLEELSREYDNPQLLSAIVCKAATPDPELDHFMESYCHALHKYEEELSKPFNEAMAFLQKVELQISHVSKSEFRLPLQGQG